MNRGYAGFYKGHYLRSSYEYAYAIYLDYHSIHWGYEESTYRIGNRTYKPDFFLYNQNQKLIKIVEIKSRNTKAKAEARKALALIQKCYQIDCELLSYEELLNLYKTLPFTLNSVITRWLNDENTTINKSASGKLNAHFNMKHSEEAKRKIGEHTKRRWASDSITRSRMREGLKRGGVKKGYIRIPREKRECRVCSKGIEVLVTSTQRFCSRACSGKVAIKNATKRYVEKRSYIHECIKDYIIQWSLANKDIVLNTPLNKISPAISALVENIHNQFGVKDLRVISKAVFGEDRGRKELIRFMKKICNEKVC